MFREHDLSCIVYIYNSAVNLTDLTDYCIVFLINFDCACCALSSDSHEAVACMGAYGAQCVHAFRSFHIISSSLINIETLK